MSLTPLRILDFNQSLIAKSSKTVRDYKRDSKTV